MDTLPQPSPDGAQAVEVLAPAEQTVPLVLASPHSGRDYPASFLEASALDARTLRRSEDSFVDELFAAAPRLGAPLLRALFPRAYLDPNREPYELDPAMFRDALPPYVNARSPRVAAGLGTIARVVSNGADIYARRLRFSEAEARIETLYRPYHEALRRLIDATIDRFGCCILLDCHSMPSIGGPMDQDNGLSRVDFVLGDCFGSSCASLVVDTAESALRDRGYRVVRNAPYAGGFTTRHYGQPYAGVHTLQIETNRRLYMDESTHTKSDRFASIAADLGSVVAAVAALPTSDLTPK